MERRRRGEDFFANFGRALEPAFRGEVDVVVHGGDVFHRPRIRRELAYRAYEPLRRIAASGIPVVLVPGNHERGRLPHLHLADHPRVHVFDRPRTVALVVRGALLRLTGFPFERGDVRGRFRALLREAQAEVAGERAAAADEAGANGARKAARGPAGNAGPGASLLCIHHAVEGATVGPSDFVFRSGRDVIPGRDVPAGFAAVLSGHIHRHQVLERDLSGRPLAAPVLYPGSVERTAFAEAGEEKGTLLLEVDATEKGRGVLRRWTFRRLPARPMLRVELALEGASRAEAEARVREAVASAPDDAVLRLRVPGRPGPDVLEVLSAGALRRLAPSTMNVEVALPDLRPRVAQRRRTRARGSGVDDVEENLSLGL